MAVDIQGIFDAVQSHAASIGYFERVNTHEYKAAPGIGLYCEIWIDYIGPVPQASGLSLTTGLLTFMVRIRTSMTQEPQDAIDPAIVKATVDLLGAYSGDFELGGEVRNVDLLGQTESRLSARAGYLAQDGKLYRVMTITLPLIVNDIWQQAA
jgi:hypothetical protein